MIKDRKFYLIAMVILTLFYGTNLIQKAVAQLGKTEISLNSPTSFPVDI